MEDAADGQEGIARRTLSPDLVLLDVDTPVKDGLAALRENRADEAPCSIPVLFRLFAIGRG